MKQPIAGVAPSETNEVTVMEVWPSIGRYWLGRVIGKLCNNKAGFYIFRVGNLLALFCIPPALALYFFRLAPAILPNWNPLPLHGGFVRLTNQRIIELRNEIHFVKRIPFFLSFKFGAEVKSVGLDRFDEIQVQVLPGHEWYDAGDLVFFNAGTETFRLPGISRPEAFRQVCLKSRLAYVGVKSARQRELAPT